MNFLTRFLIALSILWAGSFSNAAEDESSESWEDEVYLSFRYQGVIDEIMVAIAKDGEFFFPLTELFELLAINYTLSPKSFSVSGYYLHEDNTYLLDFGNYSAYLKDQKTILYASDFLIKDVDFFVKANVFEELFGLNLNIDLSRLVLKLETKDVLPIISRYENRRSQQRRMQYTQVSDEWYPLIHQRDQRILNGGLLDYTLFSTASKNNSNLTLNTSMGGEILFGDVQGTVITTANEFGASAQMSGVRWRYVLDKSPYFTRANIGALTSKGLNQRSIHGFSISNEPILKQTSFDQYIIDGNTDPEAEIELYQNDRLVEVATADDAGYYRFFVPLNYGISRFKIRIYAKQGHVIELDRQVDIPFNFLPPGELRYHLNGGVQTSIDPTDTEQRDLTQLAISYGVNKWLSSKIGVDYGSKENQNKPIIYNQLSSRIGGAMMLNLDLVYDHFYKMTTQGRGSQNSSWNFDYTYYQSKSVLNPLGYIQTMNAGIYFPMPVFVNPIIVRVDGSWEDYEEQDIYGYNIYLSQTIRGLRIRAGLKEDHGIRGDLTAENSTAQMSAVYSIPRNPLYHALIRGTYIRSDINFNNVLGKFESFSFQLSKQYSKSLKFQFAVGEDLIAHNRTYELGISWDAEKFRSISSIENSNHTHSVAQTIRGSIALDRPNGEFLWDNRQQVGRAGASIRMFVDEDNSGRYDEGEELLPGNAVSIKRASARQLSKSGISRLSQLQPYRRYNFEINESNIMNPLLIPKNKEFSVILDPNSFKVLDIPFFTTGIIDGRVDKMVESTLLPISGLRIHVKGIGDTYESTLRTFADGSYYSMEIPPGDYEAWVDESQLEFLGVSSEPGKIEFTVTASADGDFIEGLDFILK
ncbi:MAG: hypothetical protein HQ556_07575 [Candidatus Marinimicrobia bacterium]|nr:hypothetical protein [Candidatus Neomarinimicrobiota bacterium]